MYKEFYSGSALLGFPLFALLFFVAVFSFVVFRVMRKRQTPHLESLAHLPLADDSQVAARGAHYVR